MKKLLFRDGRFYDSIVVMALSIFIIVYSFDLNGKLEWTLSPALMPMVMGIILLGLSIVLMTQTFNARKSEAADGETEPAQTPVQIDWVSLGVVVLMTIVYFVLLPRIHFINASILFLFALMVYLGEKTLWLSGVVSVGTVFTIYYVFGKLLSVRLP